MKQAIVYLRVSTTGQAEEGISLEAQESKARAWCELNDYEVKAVFTDAGISGKSTANREGLQNALDSVSKDNALVVYSLSRLARSTKDTIEISEKLNKKGVDLVSLSEKIDTTTAAGKMVFRMLAVLSEFERDQVSERTTVAMQHKKAKGERVGSIPYGFKLHSNGVDLIHNEIEQEIIKLINQLNRDGLNLSKIAAHLNNSEHKARGAKWYAQTIKNILTAKKAA